MAAGAGRCGPGPCAGGVHGGEEVLAVETPIPRHRHLGAQTVRHPDGRVGEEKSRPRGRQGRE